MIYSLLITAVYLIGARVDSSWLPSPATVFSLIILSLYLGFSLAFVFSDLLIPSLRLLIHFLATLFVFWLTFVKLGGYLKNGGSALTVIVAFTALYALAAGITALCRRLWAALTPDEGTYRSMFAKTAEQRYEAQFGPSDGGKEKKR